MDALPGRQASVYSSMTWRSYAKINLYLEVLKKRRDSYHNIETIFQTISLYDELTFLDDTVVSMTCTGENLEAGTSNLVYCAAMMLKEYTGYPRGARIQLVKRIPVSAGLAGGSGNAAATLIALNKLWDLRLNVAQLLPLARKLGADVTYCLYGGTVAATLRGDCLTPLPAASGLWFVLVHPPIAVSAGQVYGHPQLGHSKETAFAGRTPSFRKAIKAFAMRDMEAAVFNRMEAPVFNTHNNLASVKQQILDAGCEAAAMSGSGPTMFGVCRSQQQALRVVENLKHQGMTFRTNVASLTPVGVERIA